MNHYFHHCESLMTTWKASMHRFVRYLLLPDDQLRVPDHRSLDLGVRLPVDHHSNRSLDERSEPR